MTNTQFHDFKVGDTLIIRRASINTYGKRDENKEVVKTISVIDSKERTFSFKGSDSQYSLQDGQIWLMFTGKRRIYDLIDHKSK